VSDDIVEMMLREYDHFNCSSSHAGDYELLLSGADEIKRLRVEVDRWKSLCERAMAYQLGLSDWQDIRISYDTALGDYNAQRSS
jgi:uncharacterized protein (DUF885 family)